MEAIEILKDICRLGFMSALIFVTAQAVYFGALTVASPSLLNDNPRVAKVLAHGAISASLGWGMVVVYW